MKSHRKWSRVVPAWVVGAVLAVHIQAEACSVEMTCKPIVTDDRASRELLLLRNLERIRRSEGADSNPVAEACEQLGAFYMEIEETYDQGEPWFRRAVSIRKDVFGAESQNYAASLGQLAGYLDGKQSYGEEETLLWTMLGIETRAHDSAPGEVIWSRVLLARLYESQGAWSQAEVMWWDTLQEARSAEEAERADRAAETADDSIGADDAEDAEDAEDVDVGAMQDEAETDDPTPTPVSTARNDEESSKTTYTVTMVENREDARAADVDVGVTFETATDEIASAVPRDVEEDTYMHVIGVYVQEGLARVLEAQGRLREAEPLRRDIYATYAALHWREPMSMAGRALADLLARLHERAEAAALYRKALAQLESEGRRVTIEYVEMLEALAGVMPRDTSPEILVRMRGAARTLRQRLAAVSEARIQALVEEDSCDVGEAYEAWIAGVTALEGGTSPSLLPILERYAAYHRGHGSVVAARSVESRLQALRKAQSFGSPRPGSGQDSPCTGRSCSRPEQDSTRSRVTLEP